MSMASKAEFFYSRLYDQRILHLQGCLVELQFNNCYAMMKEVQKGLSDQALQQS